MKITHELLQAATLCSTDVALRVADPIDRAMATFGIAEPIDVAMFLAQTAHESSNFQRVREDLYYSNPRRLMVVWPKRFPSETFAIQYIRNPEKLANYVYCNRLGNGDIASGDGSRFIGRGYIQVTGRANYAAFSQDARIAASTNPALLELPSNAALSAAWFLAKHGFSAMALAGDYRGITVKLNGALVGYEDGNDWGNDDRVERLATAKRALGL
jgi:putative chitinase